MELFLLPGAGWVTCFDVCCGETADVADVADVAAVADDADDANGGAGFGKATDDGDGGSSTLCRFLGSDSSFRD